MHLVRVATALILLGTAGAASAGTGKSAPETSWGKPGVSMLEYRRDAAMCVSDAITMDISKTPAVQKLVKASRALDNIQDTSWMYHMPQSGGIGFGSPGIAMQRTIMAYRVGDQFDAIRELQYQKLQGCLTERGYRQFRLTDEQQRTLRKLKMGSKKRRAYLHSLAVDAEVLARQAV